MSHTATGEHVETPLVGVSRCKGYTPPPNYAIIGP